NHVARRDPGKAAIVADVHLAVGTERRTVGTAGNLCDDLLAAIGPDPGQALAADFDQHDRAVGHRDRPFGQFEIGGKHANVFHEASRLMVQADSWPPAPRANITLREVMTKSLPLAKQTHDEPRRRPALRETALGFDRHPDLEAAIAGFGIELLVIAFEVGRI